MLHRSPGPYLAVLFGFLVAAATVWAVEARGPGMKLSATGSERSEGEAFEVTDLAREQGISFVEAEERLGWQEELPALVDDVRADLGEAYGGVWVDPADGDRIKVAVARRGTPADRSGAALAASEQGIGSAVDVVSVSYSEAELRSTLAQVASRVAEVDVPSGPPVSVGLRPDRNAVVLHLPAGAETTPSSEVAELVDDVTTAFGDMVQIEYDAVSVQPERCVYNTYCDPPLRGGIMMWGARYGCTGAFLARSRSDGKLYQLTAGHCVVGDRTAWTTHFANGSRHAIGPPHSYAFDSRGDMAILRVNNPSGWRARAWVQVTDGPDTGRNESYNIASDASSTVGQRVCITGASSAMSSCGRVTELEVTVNLCLDGACHTMELNRASYCGRPGDSGSPIYASHVAYGIHSASSADCDKFFQDIREAEAVLNVNVSHES